MANEGFARLPGLQTNNSKKSPPHNMHAQNRCEPGRVTPGGLHRHKNTYVGEGTHRVEISRTTRVFASFFVHKVQSATR